MSKKFMSVKLDARQIDALEQFAKKQGISRSAAIRFAVVEVTSCDPDGEFTEEE